MELFVDNIVATHYILLSFYCDLLYNLAPLQVCCPFEAVPSCLFSDCIKFSDFEIFS